MDGSGRALGVGTTFKLYERDKDGNPVQETGDDGQPLFEDRPLEAGSEATGRFPVYKTKTYIMEPLTMDDYGLIEQHILATRPSSPNADAFQKLMGIMTPDQQRTFLDIVHKDLKKGGNKVNFRDTTDGFIFTMWIMLRKNYPDEFKTLEDATRVWKLMSKDQQTDFANRRSLASGTDTLGNSTGRSLNVPPAPADSKVK
jgi:hypothetical protein